MVPEWVVLKVAQRCNLDCDYCYVYHRGDQVWRTRPRFIGDEVLLQLSERINESVRQGKLRRFVVELHGGEPLLLGKARMKALVTSLRERCAVDLDFHLQTNGLLLDEEWGELFGRNRIRIGVSLDGPPELGDRHRVDLRGQGTSQRVLDNILRLRETSPGFRTAFSGVLCVIDPHADGAALVDWFREHGFSALDFLLPDGNHVNRPAAWSGAEPYYRFLSEAFDRWYELESAAPKIRTFEVMVRALMGVVPELDALGGDLRRLCVVETNGAIGLSDTVRMCGGAYAEDLFDIRTSDLGAPGRHFEVEKLQAPCDTCRSCPAFRACGGGYLPHRFDGVGFANPSIYCDALFKLVCRIQGRLREDVPDELWVGV